MYSSVKIKANFSFRKRNDSNIHVKLPQTVSNCLIFPLNTFPSNTFFPKTKVYNITKYFSPTGARTQACSNENAMS